MGRHFAVWAHLAAACILLLSGGSMAASRRPAEPENPANAKLMKLPAAERAAVLAKSVGHWCIGTEAFPMGITISGRGAGLAYWSLRCADGSAWAVQVDPLGEISAIDCQTFNENGAGKECFKKF